jgi:hypothetical protein
MCPVNRAPLEFTIEGELGAPTKPPFDDTGGQDEGEELATTETACAVDGDSPEVAVAVEGRPDNVTSSPSTPATSSRPR